MVDLVSPPLPPPREFRVPPLILTGAGCALAVGARLRDRGLRRAFVVTDPVVAAAPGTAAILTALRQAGVETTVHAGVTAEPTVAMVEAALDAYRGAGADVVLGLGGGSPMDTA